MVACRHPAGFPGPGRVLFLLTAVAVGLGITAANGYPDPGGKCLLCSQPSARDTVPMHHDPHVNMPDKANRNGSRGNRRLRIGGRPALVLVLVLAPALASPAELPQQDDNRHLGVASCATSGCHGAARPRDATNVLQNEFLTWHRRDRHSGAWDALRSDRGREIARRLGIDTAHEADACLDCHADNVPTARRGDRFRLSDGVGCEACHGGAGGWIDSHSSPGPEAAEGMYPTADPAARTQLCMSCHYSHPDTPMSHRLMSAGHPPLLFDTEVFTHIQPRHYRVDADYRQRGKQAVPVTSWALGEVAAARVVLEHLSDGIGAGSGLFPELYFFDCEACHHAISDDWTSPDRGTLAPGALRLEDASLRLVAHVLAEIETALAQKWSNGVNRLHAATGESSAAVRAATVTLRETAATARQRLEEDGLAAAEATAIMRRIVREGARSGYRDRAWSEQAAMALASLLAIAAEEEVVTGGNLDRLKAGVDRMYTAFEGEDGYSRTGFREGLQRVASALD